MKALVAIVVALLCSGWSATATPQVYKCTSATGAVAFQDHACAPGQRQAVVGIAAHAPPGYVPPSLATVAPPVASAPSKRLPPPPPPLPVMYECVGAVNGKQYLSAFIPRPYFAPVGMLGYPPQSLAQAYGPGHGVGMPVPVVRPRAGGVATGMTEVQDYCLPATRERVCRFVRHEYDENQRELRMAMPSEQPPLEQRDRQMQGELRNCR